MPQAIPAIVAFLQTTVVVAGVTVSYGTILAMVVFAASVAYSAAQNAKMRNALKNALADQGRDVMARDPLANRRRIYGQVLLTGTLVYMATTGAKNKDFHLVIALAAHKCHEMGSIFFDNGEAVPLDADGNATGKYAGFFKCKKFDGDPDQEASPELMAAFPGVWTANHRLRGIAYLHAVVSYNVDLYPNSLPNIFCMVKGAKVYDPRDVAQDPNDETTWQYSANSALCTADSLHNKKWGRGISWNRIRAAATIEAANQCDETMVTLTGTEARYESHGTCTTDQSPSEVINSLCISMAGNVVDTGGLYSVRAGAYRTPQLTLTDDDMVGTFSVVTRQSRRDTFNGVKGTYISPINQWAASDFPSVKNDTYMGWDAGIRLWKDVVYPFTTSPSMAQRLAKIDLEKGRQQIAVTATYKLTAFGVMPIDTVRITRDEMGWAEKEFVVQSWKFTVLQGEKGITLAIELQMTETAAAVWDWADGAETGTDLAPNTNLPDPSNVGTPTGLTLLSDSTTAFMQPDGTFVPRLKVSWSVPNDIYVEQGGRFHLEYKKHADASWLIWAEDRGDKQEDYITDVQGGVSYDVRLQFVNAIGVHGPYASVLDYLVNSDVVAPSGITGLTGVALVDAVKLSWTNPADTDFGSVDIYYNVSSTPPTSGTAPSVKAGKTNTKTITNLNPSSTYYFYARAVDLTGNPSAWSSSVIVTPLAISPYVAGVIASSTAGNKNYYTPSAPTSGMVVGDLWFPTTGVNMNKIFSWDGTTWVDKQRVLSLADFGTGIEPVGLVSSLPTPTGYTGPKVVFLSTDHKLYRYDSATVSWTKATDGADIVANSITAGQISAGAINATTVGSNTIITSTANIGSATINNAAIIGIDASKIATGSLLAAISIGLGGSFEASSGANGFRASSSGTVFGDPSGAHTQFEGYGSQQRLTFYDGGTYLGGFFIGSGGVSFDPAVGGKFDGFNCQAQVIVALNSAYNALESLGGIVAGGGLNVNGGHININGSGHNLILNDGVVMKASPGGWGPFLWDGTYATEISHDGSNFFMRCQATGVTKQVSF